MSWSEKFAAYLASQGLTQLEVSFQLRVGQAQVHYWVHGATPREKTRERIERWSGCAVPADLTADAERVKAAS